MNDRLSTGEHELDPSGSAARAVVSLVRSKQRVADHGEVFTPTELVEAMIGLVEPEAERIDSRFLEPSFMRKSAVSWDIAGSSDLSVGSWGEPASDE